MSAFHPIATKQRPQVYVGLVPKTDIAQKRKDDGAPHVIGLVRRCLVASCIHDGSRKSLRVGKAKFVTTRNLY